jgi:hypothetical protein
VRVIPVLVDGATMPRRRQLPDDLCNLTRLNALQMSYDRYEYDESRLVTIIQKILAAESAGSDGLADGIAPTPAGRHRRGLAAADCGASRFGPG